MSRLLELPRARVRIFLRIRELHWFGSARVDLHFAFVYFCGHSVIYV